MVDLVYMDDFVNQFNRNDWFEWLSRIDRYQAGLVNFFNIVYWIDLVNLIGLLDGVDLIDFIELVILVGIVGWVKRIDWVDLLLIDKYNTTRTTWKNNSIDQIDLFNQNH